MLTWPFASVGWVSSLIQRAAASQKRINEFINITEKVLNNGTEKLEQIFKVEFKDIYFKYPNSDDYVLKNINFKLNAGMSLGIFGKTGAGKSSLVQLLCRLYEPSDGKIFINDISYQQLELNAYRKKIGYVPQDVFLFSDSIENNIAFGLNKEDFNEDEITTAAESAGLLNEIETFNDSFQTKIGERGITLSGGQKQRVSIARVLFRKPQLLIFDDCLSAVDSQTSKKIQHSLNKNSSKKISIHISHKINNISNCNHILVLENGEIVDQGNHESLLKSKGFYYDIFKKQQLEDN
jgi:ATP-binding cassette subfamily B protein